MKIAVYHNLPKGGALDSVDSISNGLKKRNKIDLYTPHRFVASQKNYSKTYSFGFKPKIWNGHNWQIRLYKDTIELGKIFLLERKISRLIDAREYDAIFVNASQLIESPFLLLFGNTPKIFYLHDPYYRLVYEPNLHPNLSDRTIKKIYESVNRFVRRFMDSLNARHADFVVANSHFSQQLFKKAYGKKSRVIYLGVDAGFFKATKKTHKSIDVLYIGSKSNIDGYNTWRHILELLPKETNCHEVLIENEWLGKDQMRRFYQASRIVLCLARKEPFGLVPLEAMATGCIPVAVAEGGYKETIVDKKTGLLLERDAQLFKKRVVRLLKDSKRMKLLQLNARNHVIKNFTITKTVTMLEKFIEKIDKK